ncbi:hypothetical protein, partial [Serratia marcescens]|uniref:hypothetical protein n=1 Tax=Serratia marcescens TaxID=615 RepID=UPI0028132256
KLNDQVLETALLKTAIQKLESTTRLDLVKYNNEADDKTRRVELGLHKKLDYIIRHVDTNDNRNQGEYLAPAPRRGYQQRQRGYAPRPNQGSSSRQPGNFHTRIEEWL